MPRHSCFKIILSCKIAHNPKDSTVNKTVNDIILRPNVESVLSHYVIFYHESGIILPSHQHTERSSREYWGPSFLVTISSPGLMPWVKVKYLWNRFCLNDKLMCWQEVPSPWILRLRLRTQHGVIFIEQFPKAFRETNFLLMLQVFIFKFSANSLLRAEHRALLWARLSSPDR